jgi:hypothetical protein
MRPLLERFDMPVPDEAKRLRREVMVRAAMILHSVGVALSKPELTREQFAELHDVLIEVVTKFATFEEIFDLEDEIDRLSQ